MDRALDEIVAERHRGGGRSRGGRRGGRRNDQVEYPRDGVRKVRLISSIAAFWLTELATGAYTSLLPHSIIAAVLELLYVPLLDRLETEDTVCRSYGGVYNVDILANLDLSPVPQSTREDNRNIDSEWVHDKFDDNTGRRAARPSRRYSPDPIYDAPSAKLRVENLHYDLTEDDLDDLFNRIGPVIKLALTYDRAGRSEGVAYVTYESPQDAKRAIREFDGANAKGQPIRLVSIPSGPSAGRQNAAPSRSLFDRVTGPAPVRARSDSPIRHSDVRGPPPSNVDRYIPGRGSRDRSRSPRSRGGRGRDGRRPGARRERGDRNGGGGGAGRGGERLARDGRPKKTQEELDAEMEDYWGGKNASGGADSAPAAVAPTAVVEDEDMIL